MYLLASQPRIVIRIANILTWNQDLVFEKARAFLNGEAGQSIPHSGVIRFQKELILSELWKGWIWWTGNYHMTTRRHLIHGALEWKVWWKLAYHVDQVHLIDSSLLTCLSSLRVSLGQRIPRVWGRWYPVRPACMTECNKELPWFVGRRPGKSQETIGSSFSHGIWPGFVLKEEEKMGSTADSLRTERDCTGPSARSS